MSDQKFTPLDKMQSAVQQAGFHYIVCLKARPTNADYHLMIEKTDYHFDAVRRTNSGTLHAEFQHWAAKAVLRDLMESFSIFLLEVYRHAVQACPGRAHSTTLAKFERMGIEDQLDILAKDFAIDDAWISRLVGYNRVRNCLAHRQGVVGQQDTNDGDDLVIRWLVPTVESRSGPPAASIDAGHMSSLISAHHVQGGAAHIEVRDKEKRFAIGSRLNLLPTDILEICSTFQLVAAGFSNFTPRG